MGTQSIKVGTRTVKTVPISPQSHARLRIKLPQVLSADELTTVRDTFAADEVKVDDLAAFLLRFTGKAYAVLLVLAPALEAAMPEHEWQGFGSPEAMAAGEYVDEDDNAPSYDQMLGAFDTALQVNGMKRLGALVSTARDVNVLFGGPGGPPNSAPPTTRT